MADLFAGIVRSTAQFNCREEVRVDGSWQPIFVGRELALCSPRERITASRTRGITLQMSRRSNWVVRDDLPVIMNKNPCLLRIKDWFEFMGIVKILPPR